MARTQEETIVQAVEVGGWHLLFLGEDGEPRIRDVELGERLGYERPRKVRELIARLEEEGKLRGIHRGPTVGRRGFVEEIIDEAWLTEAQALKVAAKSETDVADALLDEMIRVFMLARRGRLPAASDPALVRRVEALEGAVIALAGRRTRGPRAEQLALPLGAVTQLPRQQAIPGVSKLDAQVALVLAAIRSQPGVRRASALGLHMRRADLYRAMRALLLGGVVVNRGTPRAPSYYAAQPAREVCQ